MLRYKRKKKLSRESLPGAPGAVPSESVNHRSCTELALPELGDAGRRSDQRGQLG